MNHDDSCDIEYYICYSLGGLFSGDLVYKFVKECMAAESESPVWDSVEESISRAVNNKLGTRNRTGISKRTLASSLASLCC